MSRRQVGGLLLRLQANLRPDGLRKGNLSDDGVGRLGVADTALRGMPITLIDEVPMSIDQVRGAMMNLEAMGHVDLWIIDYLQLITNDASDSELDVITRVLKTLTLELGTHVLLLSQLNRDCERRQDKRPSLADLRGSGGIEQNANNVVLVHRPGFYPELLREARRRAKENGKDEGEAAQKLQEHVTLIFTKTRNGPTGETNGIKWNPERARFEEGLDHGRHF
jgi:replicative DNA helicase